MKLLIEQIDNSLYLSDKDIKILNENGYNTGLFEIDGYMYSYIELDEINDDTLSLLCETIDKNIDVEFESGYYMCRIS